MHKRAVIGIIFALVSASLSDLPAGEIVGKEETPEAAETQLEKMRAAAGKLERFETDCLVSDLDTMFTKDERWRIHLYADETDGFRYEVRSIDLKRMTARRTAKGDSCELSTKDSATWVCKGDTCTIFCEKERTYETGNVGRMSWLVPLKTAPHQFIPPWLDSSVSWKELNSRYEIKQARSNEFEFVIEFSIRPRLKDRGFRRVCEERLEATTHVLVIDRRTNLPKRWEMVSASGTLDRILIFERIDLHPAKRALTVVLDGYQDAKKVAQEAARKRAPEKDDGEPFRTIEFAAGCFRVLTCLL
jgi:hypothetical protein